MNISRVGVVAAYRKNDIVKAWRGIALWR